ncbi:S-isoprenylcysteine methyltransferase-like protein [Candidatus Nitrosoglobus terrae]|uniref:S-isoprenylcysteine methyltransferase-like protein n=1 Tax=Candidatus Nitrosoglobus terrae TaxID=1630141 RepID=A0A1Q2SMW2_9GAMM|nr:isoprenylcysteine carboxylmethyltransferase family protein [Candidatus Nitrosoglobus terrae]BAW80470.1 S-isoprenylcysteine methyltransferase-like protein [Candidatus Nitrosoglobus terrae]
MKASLIMLASQKYLLIRYGDFLFKYRNIVFPIVLCTLLFGFRPMQPSDNSHYNMIMNLFGFLVSAMGETIRVAVIGLAYIKRGGVNKRVHADTLVATGIFAHCRNPLYLGNILILLGFFIIHNNPWVYVLGLGFFLISYSAIVAAEESYLRIKFGTEYQNYRYQVNRWLPKLRGLKKTLKSMKFNWNRVIAKDYASVYSWMVFTILLIAYERVQSSSTWETLFWSRDLGITLILLTIGFVVARFLKKSGRLSEKSA